MPITVLAVSSLLAQVPAHLIKTFTYYPTTWGSWHMRQPMILIARRIIYRIAPSWVQLSHFYPSDKLQYTCSIDVILVLSCLHPFPQPLFTRYYIDVTEGLDFELGLSCSALS